MIPSGYQCTQEHIFLHIQEYNVIKVNIRAASAALLFSKMHIWTWLFLTHFAEAETPSYMKESNNAVATVTAVTSSPTRQKVWKTSFGKQESRDKLNSTTGTILIN